MGGQGGGEDQATVGLQFNRIGFDQTRKNVICVYWNDLIQTSQTWDQKYIDPSPTLCVLWRMNKKNVVICVHRNDWIETS